MSDNELRRLTDAAVRQEAPDPTTDAEPEAEPRLPQSELEQFVHNVMSPWQRRPPEKLDMDEPAPEPPVSMTAADFVEAVYIAEADSGIDAAATLRWASSCSPDEWATYCRETDWPVSARPGWVDLPTSARTAGLQAALDEESARIKAGGRRRL